MDSMLDRLIDAFHKGIQAGIEAASKVDEQKELTFQKAFVAGFVPYDYIECNIVCSLTPASQLVSKFEKHEYTIAQETTTGTDFVVLFNIDGKYDRALYFQLKILYDNYTVYSRKIESFQRKQLANFTGATKEAKQKQFAAEAVVRLDEMNTKWNKTDPFFEVAKKSKGVTEQYQAILMEETVKANEWDVSSNRAGGYMVYEPTAKRVSVVSLGVVKHVVAGGEEQGDLTKSEMDNLARKELDKILGQRVVLDSKEQVKEWLTRFVSALGVH